MFAHLNSVQRAIMLAFVNETEGGSAHKLDFAADKIGPVVVLMVTVVDADREYLYTIWPDGDRTVECHLR